MKRSQNTVVNLMTLLSIIILLFLAQFGFADNNGKAKAINIKITKADIHIGYSKLNTPPDEDELITVLGNYSRSHGGALAWDNVGIEIFRGYKKSKFIRSLKIYLKKRSPFEKPKTNSLGRYRVDMRPIHDFSGTLTIDGIKISSDTSIPKLNKSLKGAEFSKDALYKTYRRSYVPNPKNKNVSCTIYVKLSDSNTISQVSRSCIDWRKYNSNATKKTVTYEALTKYSR